MLQCMAEVGEDMVGLPLLKFGGGVGGVAHLTQNNVALQKVFFSYSRKGLN